MRRGFGAFRALPFVSGLALRGDKLDEPLNLLIGHQGALGAN